MTPQQATFADYFAHWGLTLPDEAVARRGDGHLHGAGWSVRFVWRGDGTLLFRAGHRMTNERMNAIPRTAHSPRPNLRLLRSSW